MKKTCLLLTPFLATIHAGELQLSIEIPQLDVAQYHRPYVAAWIEKADKSHLANLAVWYDLDMKNAEGEKWLKDMRQWWRRSGRELKMPADGISGPTKPVGTHAVTVPAKVLDAATLPAGEYTLVVEAAREVGGRELVRVPFTWDGRTAVEARAAGTSELGKIGLVLKPD